MKHTDNNTLNCLEKQTKQGAVFEEEVSKFRVNRKDTVSVLCIDYLKRHRGSAVDGIFGSTGWTKPAVAPKRRELKSAAGSASIHDTAEGRVTAVNHAVDIFDDRVAGMQFINKLFVIIFKDFLQYVHGIIIEQKE